VFDQACVLVVSVDFVSIHFVYFLPLHAVFGYEPNSIFPIEMVTLAKTTCFMPLPKTKVIASGAISVF